MEAAIWCKDELIRDLREQMSGVKNHSTVTNRPIPSVGRKKHDTFPMRLNLNVDLCRKFWRSLTASSLFDSHGRQQVCLGDDITLLWVVRLRTTPRVQLFAIAGNG